LATWLIFVNDPETVHTLQEHPAAGNNRSARSYTQLEPTSFQFIRFRAEIR
jgi:hypothetical protein